VIILLYGGVEIRKTETMDLFACDRTKGRWRRVAEDYGGAYISTEYEIVCTRSNYKKKKRKEKR